MQTYQSIIKKANFYAFLALIASLPFPMPIIHVCWLVWVATWLLEFRFLHRENIRINRGIVFVSIGVVVWLIANVVSVLWANNTHEAWVTIGRYTSILAIPIVGIFGVNSLYDGWKCIKILIISCLISFGVYLFTHYWVTNAPLAMNKHAEFYAAIDWLHMDELLLHIKHRMHYTNLLCMVFPCMVIAYRKIGLLPAIITGLLLIADIIMTGSRIALINLIIVGAISLCWFVLRHRKAWVKGLGISIAVLVVAGSSVAGMYLHPRNAKIDLTQIRELENNSWAPTSEPRIAIWHTALERPGDYLAHGVGVGNATDYMVSRYQDHGWACYVHCRYSPHNQFLNTCIELGIAAAILFAMFWFCLPFCFQGTARYWTLCLVGICIPSMMTDVLLGGLEGIVFLVVMMTIGWLLSNPDTMIGFKTDTECEQ